MKRLIQTSFHIKILILTLVFLVGGLVSYSLVKNGYFPVASVNGKIISHRTITENMEVSRRLYQQGLAGSAPELDSLFSRANSSELVKSSLESLITNIIVKKTASVEALAQAEREIAGSLKETAGLANSVKNIYGWDIQTYRERILEPQALFGALNREKGAEFEKWLAAEKAGARVRIWFLPFKWENGQLNGK